MDLYAFYPLGLLRYNSDWKTGSSVDNIQNFLQQNYQRLPLVYKFLLLAQVTRARFTFEYFDIWLRNLDIRIEIQNVIKTFLQLALMLHITGCFWMAITEANTYSFKNWICQNGYQDSNMYI